MEEISITVRIADRQYKLTIEKKEEEIFRKATKLLADKLIEYAENYAFKDKQDLLALVALQYTTSSLKFEEQANFNDNELIVRLSDIDKVLSENISVV
jgi:cell division protein ZapA (FtsZ GTPase activity inhibitor)